MSEIRTVIEQYHCPGCEGAIPRSMVTHRTKPLSWPLERSTSIRCPHCGQQHAADFRQQPDGSWLQLGEAKPVRLRLTPGDELARQCATGERQIDPAGNPVQAA